MEQGEEISQSFYCPLTMELMEDPVIDPDGHSYERSAIEAWVRTNPISPITRNQLTVADLRPNRALKDSIDKVRDRAPKSMPRAVGAGAGGAPVNVNASDEDIEVKVAVEGKNVLVSLVPPAGRTRAPLDVVCVIDVSGSMNAAAELKTATGENESFGLSVLDIVKHAMKTITATLRPHDRLALVTFSDQAAVRMELTTLNDLGRKTAETVVDAMTPGGSTNLWDGLFKGLELLRKSPGERRNRAVLLLTDGEPNIVPPRGHLPMLNNYRDKYSELPGVIYTFGFGYRLDSQLLVELAVGGNGAYSFIPDSSLVGTVFIHALSALLTSMATHLTVNIEPTGVQIDSFLGDHPVSENDNGSRSITFGTLLFGQSKDFVLLLENEGFSSLTVTLKWRSVLSGEDKVKSLMVTPFDARTDSKALEKNRFRLRFVDLITQTMDAAKGNRLKDASELVKVLSSEIKASGVAKEGIMKDLVKDLDGQVTEALSRADWYDKWGKHYLPSLKGAHLNQHCNNFKDPGVQHYGGKLFKEIRDEVDATFLKLPPPKPSNPIPAPAPASSSSSSSSRYSPSSPSYAPRAVSMSYYHSGGNPCFAGSSQVHMADGTRKAVSTVKKGDLVLTPGNGIANVRCVVKTATRSGKTSLVELPSGLLVTPYHPIRIKGEWVFPRDVFQPKEMTCDAVYSFLLESSAPEHVMIINDTECVALAHGITATPVITHDFFGSHRIVEALTPVAGFEAGLVQLIEGCVVRDEATGLVVGLRQESS